MRGRKEQNGHEKDKAVLTYSADGHGKILLLRLRFFSGIELGSTFSMKPASAKAPFLQTVRVAAIGVQASTFGKLCHAAPTHNNKLCAIRDAAMI
jgi:hypothetical protein